MKKNDVVSVITLAGEFVGKFQELAEGAITIADPRMIVQGPEGNMGFAKGICSTGVEEPDSVTLIPVFYTPTAKPVEKAYREFTSSIQLV
jgi:hypothetical protein|tara:strand:- start:264 stop:533 length:270 start_codon:yes stop_codon:yes gene_type:complete